MSSKLRLLIADDSPEFRRNVRAMLTYETEFEVVAVARDGQEALEMARKMQPDVAVMDYHMPDMDGISTIKALGRISPRTRCIIMSVDGEPERQTRAQSAGALQYLLKPFTTEDFIAAIHRAAQAPPLPTTQNLKRSQTAPMPPQPLNQQQVNGFLKTGRMDDEAARAYTEYVHHAEANPATLARLAEIFCARREWRTLRHICERMESAEAAPE
jgi:DNA-binding NarL/FixJ family response regulator